MNKAIIAEQLEQNRIPFAPELPEKLEIYFRLLMEWNGRMDLVAEAPEEELLDRHFIDSMTVLREMPGYPLSLLAGQGMDEPGEEREAHARALIDVGTGAGFPGMVLALACPGLRVTLLDSQQKRLNFLSEVRKETGAENVAFIHARAEDGARMPELREGFDFAAARAVAPLNVLCEYLLPYVRVGGRALCWKGPALVEEMAAGRRAAFLLGGKVETPIPQPIAGREWEHLILPIRKESGTPKGYPRRAGMPKEKPLGEGRSQKDD